MSGPAPGSAPRLAPPPSVAAQRLFGDNLELARRFADILADVGTAQGLLGPREAPRLWDRHLLNCAVVADLIPVGERVLDVGSGAGLPGIAMAIYRRDLRVELIEPMERRVRFLAQTVTELGLRDSVRVTRGRAPDAAADVAPAAWVVARAVAPLHRLVAQCLPLLAAGGTLLAMKGLRAADELAAIEVGSRRSRITAAEVQVVGSGMLAEPTTLVVLRTSSSAAARGKR